MQFTVRRAIRLIAASLLACVLAAGCADAPQIGPGALSSAAVADADALASRAVETLGVPGLVVVVLHGDEAVLARGHGTKRAGLEEPVDASTVFQLGSISKHMLAALVMRLVEQGHLSLDDPVAMHLPDFAHLPARLTVRHLLTHTSGIRELFVQEAYGAGIEDLTRAPEDLVRIALASPVDFSPGTRWSYSNTNYTILALLVERLTGMPYEEALARHLFRPLGLASMRQCTPLPADANEARGHVMRRGTVEAAPPENMNWIRGDGGLCGHALDVARWMRLLATGRVVAPASYALMTERARLADGSEVDYGFGLSLVSPDDLRKVAHNGAMLGFSASAAYYPDRALTLVILTNRGNVRTESLERRMARRLAGAPEPALADIPPPAETRARWAGTYDIGVFDVRIADRDGRLWLEMPPPGPTAALRYVGDGELVGHDDPDALVVTLGGGGREPSLRLFMGAMHWYGVKRTSAGTLTHD